MCKQKSQRTDEQQGVLFMGPRPTQYHAEPDQRN